MSQPITILCLASYFKGGRFIEEVKRQGGRVFLLTKESLGDEPWPRDSIEEVFLMPDLARQPDVTYAVSYLMRHHAIDRIIPLDDYDVETAAALREHLRIPGMGDTTARYFRDKLAMRVQARDSNIAVPEFSPILNYDRLRHFMERVPPPWVLKPRSEAGSMGIKSVNSQEEVWRWLDQLGDRQSYFVLEKFVPGDVFHVDSIISERAVVFSVAHQYGRPPLEVTQGGVFSSRTLPHQGELTDALKGVNRQVIDAMGMVRGVTHAEFIRAHADGQFYFLEIAARVGGANVDLLIEHATGLNLWTEWANIELAHSRGQDYRLPEPRAGYAGLLVCLARQEWPDLSAYSDPEIVWRLHKKHHAGLIVTGSTSEQVTARLDDYTRRFAVDFMASMPPLDKPTN